MNPIKFMFDEHANPTREERDAMFADLFGGAAFAIIIVIVAIAILNTGCTHSRTSRADGTLSAHGVTPFSTPAQEYATVARANAIETTARVIAEHRAAQVRAGWAAYDATRGDQWNVAQDAAIVRLNDEQRRIKAALGGGGTR